MAGEPTLSSLSSTAAVRSFGPLTGEVMLPSGKKTISSEIAKHSITASVGDYLMTIPTSSLKVDMMENHSGDTRRNNSNSHALGSTDKPLCNPNKLLYTPKLSALCYDEALNHTRPPSDSNQNRNRSSVSGALFMFACVLYNVFRLKCSADSLLSYSSFKMKITTTTFLFDTD